MLGNNKGLKTKMRRNFYFFDFIEIDISRVFNQLC